MARCHILPWPVTTVLDDQAQMREDQRQYDQVASDYTVRFYTWQQPTVSIGRFQKLSPEFQARLQDHGIPWVRRPTGGQAILHYNDLTFSIVGPLQPGQQHQLLETYQHIAQGLCQGFQALGLTVEIVRHQEPGQTRAACYATTSQADLRLAGHKFVGCAQVRRRKAFLQQGVVYLKSPEPLYQHIFQEAFTGIDMAQHLGCKDHSLPEVPEIVRRLSMHLQSHLEQVRV